MNLSNIVPVIERNILKIAIPSLKQAEIMLFIGPRQAGKTFILKQLEVIVRQEKLGKTHLISLDDVATLDLLNESPKNLFRAVPIDLNEITYIFIDEIQYLDNPARWLKYLYDTYAGKIHLVVSGSSSFYIDKKFTDSLVGRKKIFNVLTLSFAEFLHFKNSSIIIKPWPDCTLLERAELRRWYGEYLIFGGYPRVVLAPPTEKKDILHEIAYTYIKKDIYEAGIKKDETMYKLFTLFADQSGQLVNALELGNTLKLSATAVENFLYVMRKSFHVCLVRPFSNNTRKELTHMPKVYFYDHGLRNFFHNNFENLESRSDSGMLLESAVFRHLIDKNNDREINFWRTTDQHEVDFVVHGKIAYEVKTQARQFKPSKYAKFQKAYPHIPLQIVALGDETEYSGLKVVRPWEVYGVS